MRFKKRDIILMDRQPAWVKTFSRKRYKPESIVRFGGGSDCANVGSGAATTVVGGWKVSRTILSMSQFFSPAASDAPMHLDRVIINYLSSK